jgi:hypothetical protein
MMQNPKYSDSIQSSSQVLQWSLILYQKYHRMTPRFIPPTYKDEVPAILAGT